MSASAALSDDLTDLTPSPPPSQMPLPTKKKDVESGSELSEPPSEDDRPHNNNKPTTKKPRTGRGIVPAPMWEWAKKKPTKPVDDDDDDDDDDDEDSEDDDGGDIANADKTTNDDDDVDEKLADVDDDIDDRADDTKPGPDADSNLSAAVAHASDADHPKDNKKTNGIALNGILHNSFLFALWLTIDAVEPPNDDNDDDSNGITNHEEYEDEEEDGVLVKDEPTPSRVAVSPRSESLDHDDQTHLDDVDDADHELHAADRADALDALAELELKFSLVRQRIYIDKMNELSREESMVHDGTHAMNMWAC
jgi:hypothetical protein